VVQSLASSCARGVVRMLVLAVLASCGSTPPPPRDPSLIINLRWVKDYPRESKTDVNTGLYWALSFLGAQLPADANVLIWHENVVTVDLDAAQVVESTRPAWRKLVQVLKSSEEYRRMGGVDIGRFVMLALCAPKQYYALAGVSPTLQDFLAQHASGSKDMAIVESGVAYGNRLIEVKSPTDIGLPVFVAYEGTGSIKERTFSKAEVETLEVMPNGQLRFGLYDLEGHLKVGTTARLTSAGKPSKCLWCHEINLLPPGRNVTNVDGYYSTKEFAALIKGSMQTVETYRRSLRSKVKFTRRDDHSYTEYLYLGFAEPTAQRLSREWNVPVSKVVQMLQGRDCRTHADKEFEGLGDEIAGPSLYSRADVDSLAPYAVITTSSSTRETSSYEPDLLTGMATPGAPVSEDHGHVSGDAVAPAAGGRLQ
jgi:hypothetical protein